MVDEVQQRLVAVAALATGVRIAGFLARVDSAFATARRLDIARAELLVLAAALPPRSASDLARLVACRPSVDPTACPTS